MGAGCFFPISHRFAPGIDRVPFFFFSSTFVEYTGCKESATPQKIHPLRRYRMHTQYCVQEIVPTNTEKLENV